MDKSLLKRTLARFSRHTFAAFVVELFSKDRNYEGLRPLPEAGDDVFCQPCLDSYGGSIHGVVLLHFPPLELFHPCKTLSMNDPTLMKKLVNIKNMYDGQKGQWGLISPFLRTDHALNSIKFVTNLAGLERTAYQDLLIPAYHRVKYSCGLRRPEMFVGSCDSFVDLDLEGARESLERIVKSHSDGVSISFSDNGTSVRDFTNERSISSGVSPGTRSAYESVIVSSIIAGRARLHELEKLINNNASEKDLEEFLVAHYRDLFEGKYDRLESQLWLKFPGLDSCRKNRRVDIFLRNSTSNDWEVLEIKRAVRLTKTYRDSYVFKAEIMNAIQQLKNYGETLRQDRVKRHFAKEGIKYYQPVLNLVIGKNPQIPRAQWRWLQSHNTEGVRVFTFDDLIAELRRRLEDQYTMMSQLL